jgi:acetolactate synthase I/II/III large subunit
MPQEADVSGQIPVENGAEGFIELLNVNHVDYIFLNPGTDTTPIQEAIAHLRSSGSPTPQVILCTHETVALAAAHGYFLATGRPQVVLVHVDVGTQNIGGALHNAQRSRIGVVICAGRSPSIFEGERPGSRSMGIMWWQEQRDQAGIVRNFTKWDYELRFNENAHHVIQRAFQVASTEPCGPVYLTLPREVLVEKITNVKMLDINRFSAPTTPQADPGKLNEAAGILAAAQNPLIIAGYSGRNSAAVAPLVELAETIGARVAASGSTLNFPADHPLCVAGTSDYFKNADAVLIVDNDIPYIPAFVKPAPGARIIQMGIDPIKQDMVMWGFPADILLQADSAKAIPALNDLLRTKMTRASREGADKRVRAAEKEQSLAEKNSREFALSQSTQTPISAEWFCQCLAEAIDDDTIIVDESLTSGMAVARYLPRKKPGTYFSSGGSSLGFGLGASLGIKLARPEKMVVCFEGDGSFIFACPIPALWASNVYGIPFLCVIFNNQGYNAVRANLRATFGKDNFGEKEAFFAGLDIMPSPDYAMIARACNAYAEIVSDPGDVKAAIARGVEQVKSGRSAVLDVRIVRR